MTNLSKWVIAGLVTLNVLLGVGVAVKLFADRTAYAQIGGNRDYAVVSGYLNQQSVLYVLDVSSGRLIALRQDVPNRKVYPAATKNVMDDLRRKY